MFSIDEIRIAIQSRAHRPAAFQPDPSHAGVAMILGGDDNNLDACFIRRTEREEDPWSGQVAFPGGRASPQDRDAQGVAERETLEEIGLQLNSDQLLGPLPTRSIQRNYMRGSLTLSPFVYHVDVDRRASATVRQTEEVASVFWVPLRHLFDEAGITQIEYPYEGKLTAFPGIGFQQYVIWGLTLRVLASFAEVIGHPLPALE